MQVMEVSKAPGDLLAFYSQSERKGFTQGDTVVTATVGRLFAGCQVVGGVH